MPQMHLIFFSEEKHRKNSETRARTLKLGRLKGFWWFDKRLIKFWSTSLQLLWLNLLNLSNIVRLIIKFNQLLYSYLFRSKLRRNSTRRKFSGFIPVGNDNTFEATVSSVLRNHDNHTVHAPLFPQDCWFLFLTRGSATSRIGILLEVWALDEE